MSAAQDFNDKYFNPATKSMEPFRTDVTVNWVGDPSTLQSPVQTSNPINPQYCASSAAAWDLAGLLQDLGKVEVYEDLPMSGWPEGNQYTQSSKVPWIRVTDGGGNVAVENAGQMVAFFSHGFNPDVACEWMRNQFTMDLQAQANAKDNS